MTFHPELLLLGVAAALLIGCAVVSAIGRLRMPSRRARVAMVSGLAVIALSSVGLGVAVPVMGLALALNLTLGRRELYPLSAYTMFARLQPHLRRIEVDAVGVGRLSTATAYGVPEATLWKRFNTEMSAHGDQDVAREQLVEILQAAAPPGGSERDLQLLVCDYRREDGRPTVERTPLGDPFRG